jgi:hypothetical protein
VLGGERAPHGVEQVGAGSAARAGLGERQHEREDPSIRSSGRAMGARMRVDVERAAFRERYERGER